MWLCNKLGGSETPLTPNLITGHDTKPVSFNLHPYNLSWAGKSGFSSWQGLVFFSPHLLSVGTRGCFPGSKTARA